MCSLIGDVLWWLWFGNNQQNSSNVTGLIFQGTLILLCQVRENFTAHPGGGTNRCPTGMGREGGGAGSVSDGWDCQLRWCHKMCEVLIYSQTELMGEVSVMHTV